jgi:glutamyl-tRNA reductase
MPLLLLGVSHHTAPVELRERVAFTPAVLERALAELRARLDGEVVILSTCNRAEIYALAGDAEAARHGVASFLSEFHHLPLDRLEPHLYVRPDADAVRHLFRVAAGLDSLVVGEPQILGQVKDAFAGATGVGTTGVTLNKLFPHAFAVGKRVRTETGLGEGAVSVSYAAVSLAKKIFGRLAGRNVLLLGAGEMSKITAQHLLAAEAGYVAIASRTLANAEALASELRTGSGTVEAVSWDAGLGELLPNADIVITATGSTVPVVTRRAVEGAFAHRRTPIFIIDIAVPRDVDPAVGEFEQVFLYNIDDLQAIVAENVARRAEQVAAAEEIVGEEVTRFLAWLRSREAVPTVVALRQRFDAIRRAELERLEPKLATLTPEARQRVEEITRLIVEKLLIAPTEQLKSVSEQQVAAAYTDALRQLFGLAEGATTAAAPEPAPGEPVSSQATGDYLASGRSRTA